MTSKKEKDNAFSILMKKSAKSSAASATGRNNKIEARTKYFPSSLFKKVKNSTTKSSPSSISKFVQCPICNSNIIEAKINVHLDQCMMKEVDEESAREIKIINISSQVGESNKILFTNKRQHDDLTTDAENNKKSKIIQNSYNEEVTSKNETLQDSLESKSFPSSPIPKSRNCNIENHSTINAFGKMMMRSKQMHKTHKPKTYRFHLFDENGNVAWYSNANANNEFNCENVKWKSSVSVKGCHGEKNELIITSSLNGDGDNGFPIIHQSKPLVQHASKLSVPVLKSCLQKAIRRKRPLPAVRCSMELMDKAYVDFIRRLPIIILEDSYLHPDFPLLIWLMIAASKDYIPSSALTLKILRIVFEVASCSWKDDITADDENVQQEQGQDIDNNLDYNHEFDEKENMILRSLILRKQYGGMTCDIEMLRQFHTRWRSRFAKGTICEEICLRCFNNTKVKWIDTPFILHERSIKQSTDLISPLLSGHKPFLALTLHDVTEAGIDFHCSNILDSILQDATVCATLREKISKLNNITKGASRNNELMDKDSLLSYLKGLMWRFSAGVNVRQSFGGYEKPQIQTSEYEIWSELVQPHVKLYVKSYISCRLSKHLLR